MNEKALQQELQTRVKKNLAPLFERYQLDTGNLEDILKWKPIVLIIGNYSSGKSTLINELLGRELQRTGQAPTDDSFTVITAGGGDEIREIPGATLVSDEQLPFTRFREYGDRFISHFCMKQLPALFLANMAIIDSPGMLDSVTEKDRGYDYMSVLGEFARMADLVVLMFDPHKAGTIKETYTAIRSTLPETSGEDRIVFVMSRIDECDNMSDLVRSYGTLCWNLSQMTGRKDIPHIYMTYSPAMGEAKEALDAWDGERQQVKDKILNAPAFRINHILEDIDRQTHELEMVCAAMTAFARKGRQILGSHLKVGLVLTLAAFFVSGPLLKVLVGFPEEPLMAALIGGQVSLAHLPLPATAAGLVVFLVWLWFSRISFPGLRRRCRRQMHTLVELETEYQNNLWRKVEGRVANLLDKAGIRELWAGHTRNLSRIRRFLARDMKSYYNKLNS